MFIYNILIAVIINYYIYYSKKMIDIYIIHTKLKTVTKIDNITSFMIYIIIYNKN